ncbi:MAG: DUF3299 domain-containing protein [Gammaproteobacteria bacterium]|nr:MAG: DUF3299 domain-containing protein [Gammaproteobacteria bacterium]
MTRLLRVVLLCLATLGPVAAYTAADGIGAEGEYQTIEWTDLMPEDDLEALLNPPEYLDEIEDGAEEDVLENALRGSDDPASDRYQQALRSTRVRSEFDGRLIRIPGFIVPLDFDEKQRVSRFFLVPFFGACIHVPPPPPNQIIYAVSKEGIEQESLYDAFWLTGKVTVALTENDVATSTYAMEVADAEIYRE